MTRKNPTISVVIPSFNTSPYIGEAIQSVLDQSLRPSEVIVVDDGSTDDTVDVAAAFGDPVRVFPQPHRGPAASRNFGVAQAQGDLLAFLDSDDLWTTDKLEKQVETLQRDGELQGVFGLVRQFYTPGLEVSEAQRQKLEATVETGYHAGALLICRDAFDSVGPFDETFKLGEFIDWYARAQDIRLKLITLREVLMLRRIHNTNTGLLQLGKRSDYAKMIKKILDRRKAAASAAGTIRSERASD